jgi:uncharacterized protein
MIGAGDQIPSTLGEMTLNADHTLVLPRQKAEKGLALVKEAILDYLGAYADGLRNADLAHDLGLGSDHEGQQKKYLTYSVSGLLLKEAKVLKNKRGTKTYYTRA